jgi:hypothetical protein
MLVTAPIIARLKGLTWRASRRPKVDHSRPSNYASLAANPKSSPLKPSWKGDWLFGTRKIRWENVQYPFVVRDLASKLTKAEQYILKRYGQNVRLRPSKFAMRMLLAQSGHALVHCTCPLMTQSGHSNRTICFAIFGEVLLPC